MTIKEMEHSWVGEDGHDGRPRFATEAFAELIRHDENMPLTAEDHHLMREQLHAIREDLA